MNSTYITTAVIILAAIAVIYGIKKLIASEEKKNDPTLAEPRDSDTAPGNQGTRETRNK